MERELWRIVYTRVTWVARRFHPEYVVGGVVSGRWATNGGGALQIPRVLRRAQIVIPRVAMVRATHL